MENSRFEFRTWLAFIPQVWPILFESKSPSHAGIFRCIAVLVPGCMAVLGHGRVTPGPMCVHNKPLGLSILINTYTPEIADIDEDVYLSTGNGHIDDIYISATSDRRYVVG